MVINQCENMILVLRSRDASEKGTRWKTGTAPATVSEDEIPTPLPEQQVGRRESRVNGT